MNTIYPKLICLSLVFISTISFGCMPFPPSSTLLGRLQGVEPTSHVQSYTSVKSGYLLHLSHTKFVYGSDLDKLTKTAPQQLEATFNSSNVKPHDLIIALADTYNGARPSAYRVYAIARVTCHNDIITLGKPILAPDNPGWNRQAEHCGASKEAGILDGFVGDKSQADYLAELQVQYPTCGALQSAFPDRNSTQNYPKGTRFWQWLKRLFG